MDLNNGLRDGSAIVCMASVLDRSTKVDQGACFVQGNGADVLNKVDDTSVCLIALLCNTVEETALNYDVHTIASLTNDHYRISFPNLVKVVTNTMLYICS